MENENRYPGVFIAEGARIVGDVTIGEGSSVWYNAVIRGDSEAVRIGRRTNVHRRPWWSRRMGVPHLGAGLLEPLFVTGH